MNSSGALPHLRQLTIKAILATGWKVRAEFRTKWIDIFEKVFLSRRPDPNPAWTSIEAYYAQKNIDPHSEEEQIEDTDDDDEIVIRRPRLRHRRSEESVESEPVLPSRRSTRLRASDPVKVLQKPVVLEDPVTSLERGQRSTRSRITYAESETSDESENELGLPTRPVARRTRRGDLPTPQDSHSSDTQSGSEVDQRSVRVAINMSRMSKELANLNATVTARKHLARSRRPGLPSYHYGNSPSSDSDSDDRPLLRTKKGEGRPASDIDSDDEPLWAKNGKGKSALDIDSDDEPMWAKKVKGKGKGKTVQAVLHASPFVQGMCDVVKVCCDNMRPREQLFSEGDFLNIHDDSDDSEWDGEDRIPGEDEIAF